MSSSDPSKLKRLQELKNLKPSVNQQADMTAANLGMLVGFGKTEEEKQVDLVGFGNFQVIDNPASSTSLEIDDLEDAIFGNSAPQEIKPLETIAQESDQREKIIEELEKSITTAKIVEQPIYHSQQEEVDQVTTPTSPVIKKYVIEDPQSDTQKVKAASKKVKKNSRNDPAFVEVAGLEATIIQILKYLKSK